MTKAWSPRPTQPSSSAQPLGISAISWNYKARGCWHPTPFPSSHSNNNPSSLSHSLSSFNLDCHLSCLCLAVQCSLELPLILLHPALVLPSFLRSQPTRRLQYRCLFTFSEAMAANHGAWRSAMAAPTRRTGVPRRGQVKAAIARSVLCSITSLVHGARSSLSRRSIKRSLSWSSGN